MSLLSQHKGGWGHAASLHAQIPASLRGFIVSPFVLEVLEVEFVLSARFSYLISLERDALGPTAHHVGGTFTFLFGDSERTSHEERPAYIIVSGFSLLAQEIKCSRRKSMTSATCKQCWASYF